MQLGDPLITKEQIATRIAQLAAEIDAVYQDSPLPLVLLCVLKGSVMFTVDLSRALTVPLEYEFIAVRSYGNGTVSSGQVELVKDVGISLKGRDVLMVEDIIDTGLTIHFLREHLARHEPASLRLVALLNKQIARSREVNVDFSGFPIDNHFVVGYGLDYGGKYRNLPEVRLVQP